MTNFFNKEKKKKKRIAEKSTMERKLNFGASLVAEMVQETQV